MPWNSSVFGVQPWEHRGGVQLFLERFFLSLTVRLPQPSTNTGQHFSSTDLPCLGSSQNEHILCGLLWAFHSIFMRFAHVGADMLVNPSFLLNHIALYGHRLSPYEFVRFPYRLRTQVIYQWWYLQIWFSICILSFYFSQVSFERLCFFF